MHMLANTFLKILPKECQKLQIREHSALQLGTIFFYCAQNSIGQKQNCCISRTCLSLDQHSHVNKYPKYFVTQSH
jgi:hypothetical protein